jgi:hypothetical protein
MKSVSNYNESLDYCAIMMNDPLYERLDSLGHQLVMMKIDLNYAEQQAKMYKDLYELELEFNSRQR